MGQKKMYIPLNPATKTYEGEVKFNNSENEFTGKKVSADEIELNGQDINQTFLTKQEAEELVRTEQLEDVVRENDIKDFITEDNADEKYLPNNKGKTYIPKSYVKNLKQIDLTRQFTLEQAVGLLNELIASLQGEGKVVIEDVEEIEQIEDGEYQTQEVGTALNDIIGQIADMGFEIGELSQNYDLDELAEKLNEIITALQETPDFEVEPLDLTDGEYTLFDVTEKLNEMIGALTDDAN